MKLITDPLLMGLFAISFAMSILYLWRTIKALIALRAARRELRRLTSQKKPQP